MPVRTPEWARVVRRSARLIVRGGGAGAFGGSIGVVDMATS